MLRNVDRLLLRVPQLQCAVRYYQDVLGLKLLRQNPTIANFQLSDCHTELVLHTDPDLPAEAVYYLVDDVRDNRKSTRLNSSHLVISYAVFCLKKKNNTSTCES